MKHTRKLAIFICSLILSFSESEFSKSSDSLKSTDYKYSITGSVKKGYVMPTNKFVTGWNSKNQIINSLESYSINLLNQTTGTKEWHIEYNYPAYGIGFYTANFYNPEEIGYPMAVYAFFSGPFYRWNKLSFNYDLGLGCAFNWKPYNVENNPNNCAIGAKESAYVNIGLFLEYMLNRRFSFITGVDLAHFSNGGMKRPNDGFNTISPKISIRYNLYSDGINFNKKDLGPYNKKYEWMISTFTGAKDLIIDSIGADETPGYECIKYYVYGIETSINCQINRKSKIGLGIDICYDGSYNNQIDVEKGKVEPFISPAQDKIKVSLCPTYELVINKVSIILQPSFYIYRKKIDKNTPVFYQRIGFKYHITNNIFSSICLRSYHFRTADFIEWSLGYRMNWK